MKIVYFYQYYTTPKGSYGTRVHEFCKRWVKEGHDVTVVTGIYDKSDLEVDGLLGDLNIDGVKIKVINLLITNKHNVIKRTLVFLLYSLLSIWYALTLKADVVISSSGPITVGIPGLVARYLRGRNFVFEVRDLWPEVVVQLGVIKNKPLLKLAYWFENLCYKSASLIVTLSPGMAEWIQKEYQHKHIISVPNACDNYLFGPKATTDHLPQWALDNHYILYTGNIGKVNNSKLLIEAAKRLQKQQIQDVKIVLIGDGQQRKELQEQAQKEGLNNFMMLGLMPKKELVAWVQNAFFSAVPLIDVPVIDTSSPNKLFDSLASGVPVIQNTQGWIKRILADNNCGITVGANDAEAFVREILSIKADKERWEQMGQNAKKLSKAYDRDLLAQRMLDGILAVKSHVKVDPGILFEKK